MEPKDKDQDNHKYLARMQHRLSRVYLQEQRNRMVKARRMRRWRVKMRMSRIIQPSQIRMEQLGVPLTRIQHFLGVRPIIIR
jgi:hypothetical protein